MNDEEVLEHIQRKLTNLEGLCQLYDQGNPYIGFTMAAEIRTILTENAAAVRARGALRFPTVADRPGDAGNLAGIFKLLVIRATYQPDAVDLRFQPTIFDPPIPELETLPFTPWWNRDVIYRASARPPGFKGGQWPPPDQLLPEAERPTLTRRRLIDLARNKFGAHLDEETPEVLDRLQRENDLGIAFIPNQAEEDRSRIIVGPTVAMIRSIAEEVLIAYGRRPLPANPRRD